ncbi:oligosaccharide flippase family protein [Candidatus Sumerlaeota bacterium]|nr:oligosaccharide flippase family protein [Candidatus Sumerlaeota bacterium]
MNLSRQTVVVAAARLTTQAAIVISGIVIGRFLLREQAGIVQKGLLVTNMCILMGMFGIQTFLYTALPKTPDENKRSLFVQSLLFLSVIGALLATAVFVGRVPLAHYLNAPEMTSLLMWAALSILLSLPAGAAEPLLIATGHPWRALCMAIPASCLQLAVLFYACVFAPDNATAIPKAVFIGLTLAALTRVIIGLFHAATTLRGKWMPTQWHQSLKDMMSFILPVGAVSIIDTLAVLLDRNIVARFFSSGDYALYAYGAAEIPLIGLLIGSVTPVLLPEFSRLFHQGKTTEMTELWHRACLKTATVLFTFFTLFMFIAPSFLVLLYSETYRESSLYMRIYLCMLPLRITAFMPLLYVLGKQNLVLVGSVGDLTFNALLSLTLVCLTPLGMAGAAIATVTSTICQSVFYLSVIRRSLNLPWNRLLPWAQLARKAVFCLLCFLPTAAIVISLPTMSPLAICVIGGVNLTLCLRMANFRI